jgi:nucleotide-binding universal stress UspA family protein
MKRILAATDGSEDAGSAVDYAADLAKGFGAGLLIVNVIGGYGLPDEIFKRFTRSQSAWLAELLEANSAEVLRAARERALQRGAAPVEVESRHGDAAPALAEIAEDRDADMIVVGRHGASGAASLLLGSVAHKLVNMSRRPVLVVP